MAGFDIGHAIGVGLEDVIVAGDQRNHAGDGLMVDK